MMKKKTVTKVKMAALAQLALASCWGWSCSTDMRDAVWTGVMDYVTGTTTDALSALWSAESLIPAEE